MHSLADALIAVKDEVLSAVILDHTLRDGESSQLRDLVKERSIPYVVHSGYAALYASHRVGICQFPISHNYWTRV